MNPIQEMAQAMLAALRTVPGVEVTDDLGANLDPPSLVLSPPVLTWEGMCASPSARFTVYVIVRADERAAERLWDLTLAVAAAAETVPNATVNQADPGSFLSGGDLPCYEIQIDVSP
jgi:hypothetical protein